MYCEMNDFLIPTKQRWPWKFEHKFSMAVNCISLRVKFTDLRLNINNIRYKNEYLGGY